MDIQLTWDLFIIVFFAVIIAYSFIVGKNQTVKIILSSYIAILAADGFGNLVNQYLVGYNPLIGLFTRIGGDHAIIILKIGIFVSTIVLLATRGAFNITMARERSGFVSLIMTSTYAVLSAGLIVSTILIYISGLSLFSGNVNLANSSVIEIYQQSYLVRSMINNYNVWFTLPVMGFIISSFLGGEE